MFFSYFGNRFYDKGAVVMIINHPMRKE